tara:strand:- start:2333 stop:2692 length:360 start_codon:yes stop_codon:yes gene_type:complete
MYSRWQSIGGLKTQNFIQASVNGKKDTVEILLTYEGIDITKADDDGETSITKARNEEIKKLLKAKLKMKSSGKVLLSPLPATGKSEIDEEIVEKEDKLQDVKTEEEIPVVKVEEKIADS